MLTSPVWRSSTKREVVFTTFAMGLLLGALTTALLLLVIAGLLHPLPRLFEGAAFGVVASLALARDLGLVDVRLPENRRQIPPSVFRGSLTWGAARFGYELGTAFRTYLPAASPYVLAIGIALFGRHASWTGVEIALGFALGRLATPLLRLGSNSGSAWDEQADQMLSVYRPASVIVVAALVARSFGFLRFG